MFEHMKNYEKLMAKVSDWLNPAGKIFIHIFTHKKFAYHFQKGNFPNPEKWRHLLHGKSRLKTIGGP